VKLHLAMSDIDWRLVIKYCSASLAVLLKCSHTRSWIISYFVTNLYLCEASSIINKMKKDCTLIASVKCMLWIGNKHWF